LTNLGRTTIFVQGSALAELGESPSAMATSARGGPLEGRGLPRWNEAFFLASVFSFFVPFFLGFFAGLACSVINDSFQVRAPCIFAQHIEAPSFQIIELNMELGNLGNYKMKNIVRETCGPTAGGQLLFNSATASLNHRG
jgi:hypothetical protein